MSVFLSSNFVRSTLISSISEDQGHHEEEDEILSSTTCSNTEECYEEKDSPSEIIDDRFDLDGEVEKRLNKMVPIQVSCHMCSNL